MRGAIFTGLKEWINICKMSALVFFLELILMDNLKKFIKTGFVYFFFLSPGNLWRLYTQGKNTIHTTHTRSLSSFSVQCITLYSSKCLFSKIRTERCNGEGQP